MYHSTVSFSSSHQRLINDLGYRFRDIELLRQALTRTSAVLERIPGSAQQDYQRLEFLGDRVLNLVISDILYHQFPQKKEGLLTMKLSSFVNNNGPLETIARKLKLRDHLIMGRGERQQRMYENTKVLSDAMEALLGAIWLDSDKNYEVVCDFIARHWEYVELGHQCDVKKLWECLAKTGCNEEQKVHRLQYIEQALRQYIPDSTLNSMLDFYFDDQPVLCLFLSNKHFKPKVLALLMKKAIEEACVETVQTLLSHGMKGDTLFRQEEKRRLKASYIEGSALQLATTLTNVEKEGTQIMKLLLEHGANPNWAEQINFHETTHLPKLCTVSEISKYNPGYRGYKCKSTALHLLLDTIRDYEVGFDESLVSPETVYERAKLLLEYNASLSLKNSKGKTVCDLVDALFKNYNDFIEEFKGYHNIPDIKESKWWPLKSLFDEKRQSKLRSIIKPTLLTFFRKSQLELIPSKQAASEQQTEEEIQIEDLSFISPQTSLQNRSHKTVSDTLSSTLPELLDDDIDGMANQLMFL